MLSTRYGIFIQAGAVVNKASDGLRSNTQNKVSSMRMH